MADRDQAYFDALLAHGLDPQAEARIRLELAARGSHHPPQTLAPGGGGRGGAAPDATIYHYHDLALLQGIPAPLSTADSCLRSLEDLLERDQLREQDGFPKKIRVGRLVKPGKGGKENVVVVPTTVEEKLIHDRLSARQEESSRGGSGEGDEGEVIGEQPLRQAPGGAGPGQGEGGPHEMESSAYDLGRILTEKFELPNLKDKGKKRSLTRHTWDMTDRHRGFGQILDKKATLREIVETNIALGRIPDVANIDPSGFLIAPSDRIYRVLSREMDYESQAMVFFMRDYSGSMMGKRTELVVTQHVLIYSWLLYQYTRQVESRFILHDTEASEVDDFHTYYNSRVAGGTRVASAFRLVNEIVERENLARDYNIYVFHGTDGEDWDGEGKESVPEIEKMLDYTSRVGVTIVQREEQTDRKSEVEKYLLKSGLTERKPDLLRLDIMAESAEEPRLIEGIRRLIS
jgi:uncharacterized sporulation protein YeaH/YhbH (DUF444 family)